MNTLEYHQFLKERWLARALGRVKHRARKHGVEFNITAADIALPDYCPLLNIRLEYYGAAGITNGTPSIDRCNPSLGYVRGNVWIISLWANSRKGNMSAFRFMQILHREREERRKAWEK